MQRLFNCLLYDVKDRTVRNVHTRWPEEGTGCPPLCIPSIHSIYFSEAEARSLPEPRAHIFLGRLEVSMHFWAEVTGMQELSGLLFWCWYLNSIDPLSQPHHKDDFFPLTLSILYYITWKRYQNGFKRKEKKNEKVS